MTAQAEPKKVDTEIQKAEMPNENAVMITAPEELFERFTKVSDDIAQLAYAFFHDRRGRFGNPLDDWFKAESQLLRPVPVEITETDDNIFVKAAVAGFKPEEIEVSLKDNTLIINGVSMASAENNDGNTILREWNSNRFCRQLPLPANVAAGDVKAELDNGMLKVTMRKEPIAEPQKIPVTAV